MNNYNLTVVLAASVFAILYLFFYDVTKEHYYSSPEYYRSGDINLRLELVGQEEQLFGRMRKKLTSPYQLQINIDSDIPLDIATIKELNIYDPINKKRFNYIEDGEPVAIEFDELDKGSELEFIFSRKFPIIYNNKGLEVRILVETNVSGNLESHDLNINLVPKSSREYKFLTPNEARELLQN